MRKEKTGKGWQAQTGYRTLQIRWRKTREVTKRKKFRWRRIGRRGNAHGGQRKLQKLRSRINWKKERQSKRSRKEARISGTPFSRKATWD